MSSQTVLIPVEFPDPDPLPSTFVEGLTGCKVVLLGVYETQDELTPDERQRREIEANQVLYTLAADFVRKGETAEVELVMGENVEGAPTTVAEERDVDALLVPNPMTTFGHVLVAIRDEKFTEPITDFLCALNQEVLLHTNLLHVAESEDDVEAGERLLSDVKQRLVAEGYSQRGIDKEVVVDSDPSFAISQAAGDNDLIVMGETQEPGVERVFGPTYESIADRTELPIIVVRDT
ncbi:universal stress protein [Halorussus gelatinilyticus]|uniref:Universal stress protein n=1 Tax=Halorussus gelatinilyticus TaxID=2937524 RepID=A0A8U0IHS7_9EURY|nr:universal stress protein [Halorussus gelatinilyticus]UPW00378.1 universal stress protein [Halorussus gelatinilyticus]